MAKLSTLMRAVACASALVLTLVAAGCSSAAHGAAPAPAPTTAPTTAGRVTVRTTARPPVHPRPRPAPHRVALPVTALGDSVMVDAAPALEAVVPQITVDASTDRSALPAPAILGGAALTGRLGRSIVVGLGTNGGLTPTVLDRILYVAGGRRVVMITAHCPYCSWTPGQNAMLHAECVPDRNCRIADWDTVANAHPEWFGHDGVHMPIGGAGAQAFAKLVLAQL